MDTQLYCPNEARKALVRAHPTLNGIDYLEVLDNEPEGVAFPQQTLLVHCFKTVKDLSASNVHIDGGVRVGPVSVTWAYPANASQIEDLLNDAEKQYLSALPDRESVLVVRAGSRGDFSTYTLRLVRSPSQTSEPPDNVDRLLSAVDFSFKVDCPSDFDCKSDMPCPEPPAPGPPINYLAKDYASFRRLMLDRLATIAPEWRERNPAGIGVALVELLAYAADRLSYYQDAIATEAYLGTARARTSVRRHARLVDYRMHDGSNARTWVWFAVKPASDADGETLPAGTRLLTAGVNAQVTVPPNQLTAALPDRPTVFETIHEIKLRSAHNEIEFYTWADPKCCLPKGATYATIVSKDGLALAAGDVLIFEERFGPDTADASDADPTHRHAVRLNTLPIPRQDPLNSTKVLEISWHAEDALPFPLCLHEIENDEQKVQLVSVAHGNVALADHGMTLPHKEELPPVPEVGRYRPLLNRTDVTYSLPYEDKVARTQSATSALTCNPASALPAAKLDSNQGDWKPRHDLLASGRFAREFVVEMERDRSAYIRFGDDVLGLKPRPGSTFSAKYRVGNGPSGNVGAEALVRVVTGLTGIAHVVNPLPAIGGTAPEPIEHVRLFAPDAFRKQERAVTEADYAEVAGRFPLVQRAAAARRWTGSWYTMFVTVDRKGGRSVNEEFERDLRAFLERFRMAGYDLEVDSPSFVPLDIAFTVCVTPGHMSSDVERALLDAFSSTELRDGRRGFFHPDSFTVGQPVYLSQIVAAAMNVQGVEWVRPTCFQRWGQEAHDELKDGRISLGRFEIARLDNDVNAPENGKLEFDMQGGL